MFELPVRTEVQRFQAGFGNQFEHPLPAQTDRVPGQTESAAGLQLPAQTGSASLIRPAAERSRLPLAPRTSVWLPCTTPYGASASTASNLRFPNSAADCRVSPEKTVSPTDRS